MINRCNGARGAFFFVSLLVAASIHAAPAMGGMPGKQLLTPEERASYCKQMQEATSDTQRAAVAKQMHDAMVERARAQGVTPPAMMRDGARPHRGSMRGMRGLACGDMAMQNADMMYGGTRASAGGRASGSLDVRHAGGIAYVTGGVGQDEADALRAVAPRYSMRATFASPSGTYLSDVGVRIEKPDGSVVFVARTDGPFLFAKLPPGRYRLVATLDQQSRASMIDVPARGGVSVTITLPG